MDRDSMASWEYAKRILSSVLLAGHDIMTEKFQAGGKEATLYHSEVSGSPLIIFNNYDGDGKSVMEAVLDMGARYRQQRMSATGSASDGGSQIITGDIRGGKDLSLLCVGNLDWEHDMTPWYCPPASKRDTAFTGGADEYLKLLLEGILPECLKRVEGTPSYIGIAGYSLAGLFALYALYHTEVFACAASISGSLWFPGFKEYVFSHEMKRKPDRLYLSLGDKEARTRNQYLKSVEENTKSIAEHFAKAGIDVTFEMNPGNHFMDAALRSAKGILGIKKS